MPCAERLQLEKNYSDARATFASATANLQQRIGVCPKEEFANINTQMEWARVALEGARIALEQHIQEHCCSEVPVLACAS